MDYFTKRRLVIWGFSILILLNLSALATIAYYRFFRPPREEVRIHPAWRKHKPEPCLWKALNFTDAQKAQFDTVKNTYRNRSTKIIHALRQKRVAIIKELSTNEPDNAKLEKLADEIGKLHADLKKESIHHLLELKTICNTEQNEMLSLHFNRMLERHGYEVFMKRNHKVHKRRHGKHSNAPFLPPEETE